MLQAKGDVSVETRVGKGFIKVGLVYFLIGAVWMGFEEFIPKPQSATAQTFYELARVHVVLLGFVAFVVMGLVYIVLSGVLGKKIFSDRLAKVHFWATNVVFPIAVVTLTTSSFLIDPFLGAGMPTQEALLQVSVAPPFFTYFLCVLVGIGVQFAFVYNVFKTLEGPGP